MLESKQNDIFVLFNMDSDRGQAAAVVVYIIANRREYRKRK